MRKASALLLFWVLLSLAASAQSVRTKLNFNQGWRFKLGDYPGAERPTYPDGDWEAIGLPHSFSMPYFLSPGFYVGYGWYRKQFELPAGAAHQRVSLEFEAAFQDAEIFVNGQKVGAHRGGYTGFVIDISKAVAPGRNVVAVRLNNRWNPRLAPRAGEHVFSGGLYRDVYLVTTNQLHVAWYGTFVTSPRVSKRAATVRVQTEVRNEGTSPRAARVQTQLVSPAGKVVATFASQQQVPAGQTVTFTQHSPVLSDPQLWHPTHPALYKAVSTVYAGKKEVDRYATTFGIRQISWTADRGFFLNGEHFYFNGANVHQDHAGWGDAVTNTGIARDVQLVKEAGFTFIRGSHYPHDPAFAEACDQKGILFWSENAFWGIGGSARTPEGYWNSSAYPTVAADRPAFEASVKQQLTEMIRIHRNHPSIIVWSMSNEPFFTAPETIGPMRELLRQVVALSHQLDPTRPAAIGGAQRPLDEARIDKLGDVAGYNGDGGVLPPFQNPGVPSVVSEYGSTTATRPGRYEPGWGDLAQEHGAPVHPWRSGQAIWCAFDHGSIAGSALGKMGIVDYFRIPKRAWYWYRNAYAHVAPPAWPAAGTPARLRLEADKITGIRTDGTDDTRLLVTVLDASGQPLSNSPPIELRVVAGPGEFPTGPAIRFDEKTDIPVLDGQAAMEFRSYYAGETVIRATSPGLEPAEITVRFSGPVAYVPGKTPPGQPRTYVRFEEKSQPTGTQQFGRNNPTAASSSAPGHPSGYAADGNKATWWQPAPGDNAPAWTLDTERGITLTSIRLTFPEEAIYQYQLDVSDDRVTWRPVADLQQNQTKEASRQLQLPPGSTGRFVRIRFATAAARLSEIEVTGKMLD